MNDFDHLQSVYRLLHNQEVNQLFRDVDVPENIDDLRNILAKASLKKAGLVKDNDSASVVNLRIELFNKLNKGNQVFSESFRHSTRRRHKPQITLWFVEDLSDVAEGFNPIDGRISFRLMDAGSDNDISESQARSYANRIKSNFGSSEGFIWKKGKDMVSYCDWEMGYQLQLLCRNKDEGKRVIEKVLEVQNHTPEWGNMNYIANEEPNERYPTLPPSKPVLGRLQRMPRERPIADVRFVLSTLIIRGMQQPLILYGRDGYSGRGLID
jgi:hypothetical protein